MIKPYSHEFRHSYRAAYDLFVKGEWGKAKAKFEETLSLITEAEDPLSKAHLNFMKQNDFMPPSDWKGWKDFDE